jgi:DNA-directed RNA polymerase subunit RPC12/RpoP
MQALGLSKLDNLKAPSSGREVSHVSCPKCGSIAVLAAIEPAEPGYDKRTFRCSSCGHRITMTVRIENRSHS